MYKVIAFQISEQIQIKQFEKNYTAVPLHADSTELFYVNEDNKYFYVLSYGVVAFIGYNEVEMSESIEFISQFCKNMISQKLREEFVIKISDKDSFGYNEISVRMISPHVFRIIMLNVVQSVALDYFTFQAEQLHEETNSYTHQLEKTGKISILGIQLKKFIGKTLNIKNRLTYNLYILDSPDETWEDEYLNKIDWGLKKTFDLKIRSRSINDNLQVIKENLDLFKDILQHQKSTMLEVIIIVLILVEVLDLLMRKFF